MPLLVDTGALYALADADDDWHVRVREFLKAERQSLLVPVTVIPEAAYLIRKRLGVVAEMRAWHRRRHALPGGHPNQFLRGQ